MTQPSLYQKIAKQFTHLCLQYPWIIAFILCVLSSIIKIHSINQGTFDISINGDASARVFDGIMNAQLSLFELFQKGTKALLAIHPPGDFVMKALFIKWATFFTDQLDAVHFLLQSSVVLFMIASLGAYSIGRQVSGTWGGLFSLGFFQASSMLFITSVSSRGEMSALPFIILGLMYFGKFIGTSKRKYFYLSALMFLASSFYRSEIIFFIPAVCITLLIFQNSWKKKIQSTIIYGLVAGGYTLGKLIYPLVVKTGHISYIEAHKHWVYNKTPLLEFLTSPYIKNNFINDIHPAIPVLCLIGFIFTLIQWRKLSRLNHQYITFFTLSFLFATCGIILTASLGLIPTIPRIWTYPVATLSFLPALYFPQVLLTFRNFSQPSLFRKKGVIVVLNLLLIFCIASATKSKWKKNTKYMEQQTHTYYREALKWAKSNITLDEGIFLDYLYSWEWYYLAHFTHPDKGHHICNYGHCNVSQLGEKETNKQGDIVMRAHIKSHYFISEQKPRWYITIGSLKYKTWMTNPWVTDGNYSFTYSYQTNSPPFKPGETEQFEFIVQHSSKEKLTLKRVFSNPFVEVFERL